MVLLEQLANNLLLAIMGILTILYSSWLFLAIYPKKRNSSENFFPTISVLIPAHNEEKHIGKTLENLINSDYPSEKEIVVIDDGSSDRTVEVVDQFSKKFKNLKLIKSEHLGKANALNLGLKNITGEIVVLLDADTVVEKDSLLHIVQPFSEEKVGAVTATVKVISTNRILTWFEQIEYAGFYGWNYACNKINAIPVTSPFAAFRRSGLESIGGFRGETAVEDHDLCMHLKKEGFIVRMAPKAVASTHMPETLKGWVRQRMRWRYGIIQVLKEHWDLFFNRKHASFGFFIFPTQVYWYLHSAIYLPLVSYFILGDYLKYFVSKGTIFSFDVARYFFNWFTLFGMVDYIKNTIYGIYEFNLMTMMILTVFSLSYIFLLFSIFKFLKRITLKHLVAIFLFFPYSLMNLVVNVASIFYYLVKKSSGSEKWEKVL